MVPSLSQYRYVDGADVDLNYPHGDLDRILWDGEVMPLRTGNTENFDRNGDPIPRKNILRGEDIAFLLEAYVERLHLGNFVPAVGSPQTIPNETFTRKLDIDTLWSRRSLLLPMSRDGLIPGFDAMGSKANWWVPETGLPQTGDFEGSFSLSDAWPGLLTWPERKPIRSQDWTPASTLPGLRRSRIEAMFENLKLMTSVGCQVCDSSTFIGDARFTSEGTTRRGSSSPTSSTYMGCVPLYHHDGRNGYYASYPGRHIPDITNRNTLISGSAVVASNLLASASLTPVYIAVGQASMTENARNGYWWDPASSLDPPRGTFLNKTRYYCLVGSTVSVPASREFTVDSSTLLSIVSHLRGAFAGDGYDESFAEDTDDVYDRLCSMTIRLQEIHLIVTLDGHTRWWE